VVLEGFEMSRLSKRNRRRRSHRGMLIERIRRSGRCRIIDNTEPGYVTDFQFDPNDGLFECTHGVLEKEMRPYFCKVLGVFEDCESCPYFCDGITQCQPRVMTAAQIADHIIRESKRPEISYRI